MAGESSLELTIKLAPEDMQALTAVIRKRSLHEKIVIFFMAIFSVIAGVAGTLYIFPNVGFLPLLVMLDISLVSFVILLVLGRGYFLKRMHDKNDIHTFSEKNYIFDVDGIHVKNEHTDALMRWPLVLSIEKAKNHLFLFIGKTQAYIIPARSLPEGLSLDQVMANLQQWKATAA